MFGGGSIGQRHIRNLQKLGYSDIAAFRTHQGHYQDLPPELKVREISDWKDVADFKPDVAFITNPTSLHLETAARIAPHVKGIFIEKPLSNSKAGVKEFMDLVKSKGVVTFVGYNLQFHPLIKNIVQEMDKGHLGKPLVFQCQVGQWLADWHPYEDFKKGYYARKDLGGGVALTMIHEINLALKLFGPASKVAAFFPKSDKLSLDVDTVADIMIHHDKNAVSQVHLDYIQRPASRFGTLAFEQGNLRYDLMENKGYDTDLMYQEQLRLFLRYVAEGRMRHDLDLAHALEDLMVVEAAFASSNTGRIMEIEHGQR